MINRTIKKIIAILLVCMLLGSTTYAQTTYDSYNYNYKNEAIPSVAMYKQEKIVLGNTKLESKFNQPADFFVDNDKNVNVLDSGNGCIQVFDKNLVFLKTINFFENEVVTPMPNISGIFVTGSGNAKKYYITDPDRKRVFVSDITGKILIKFTAPETDLIPKGVEFSPSKVLVDSDGFVYIIVPNLYVGAVIFSPQGQFMGFFGSNRVELTARLLLDNFWKQILNRNQKEKIARYVPVDYNNFDIDSKNFIYTVTSKTVSDGSSTTVEKIKKINPKNNNILNRGNFGDLQVSWQGNKLTDTTFEDIAIMSEGIFASVDSARGKIFVHDASGGVLSIFGSLGSVMGTFKQPVAIDTIDDNIYVLDKGTQSITKFIPTDYGIKVLLAARLYTRGEFDSSISIWKEVVKDNSGFEAAYVGIGKSLLAHNEFSNAMHYFKLANDKAKYSLAFGQYRRELLGQWFWLIFIILILLVAVLIASDSKFGAVKKKEKNINEKGGIARTVHILFHPLEGFEYLTRSCSIKTNLITSLVILGVWIVVSIAKWEFSGYIFNNNSIANFNILVVLGQTVLLSLLWVISNWFVSTINDGSGRLTDIVSVSLVSLVPYISYQILFTILSNVLTSAENVFLGLLQIILYAWSAIILLAGLKTIHEYNIKRTLGTVVLSVFAMAIIVFLSLLLWSMLQQIFSFATSIADEVNNIVRY